MRLPESGVPEALVVGVYPSAFHVAWSPPPELDGRAPESRQRPLIASLAVDVEPAVFWDGIRPSPAEVLEGWVATSEFDPGTHGTARPGMNGPSGAGLIAEFLAPLKVDAGRCAFTDAVPWFFVKNDAKGQGAAIRDRFAPIADQLRVHRGSLPPRPTPRELVAIAAGDERRDSFRDELIHAQASLVITLGQEALDAVSAVAEVESVPTRLVPEDYGKPGRVKVGSRVMELLALVHPGFIRQTTNAAWRSAFARWRDALP